VAVALRVLAVGEEALLYHEMQVVFCARHRHVEQAAFLFELGAGAGAEIGRHAAVDHVEHVDRFPLLPLGGVDRRQDQVILVQERHARLIAGGVRRIEREFGEETFPAGIAAGDLFELDQIGPPRFRILMDAIQVRLIPEPYPLEVGRPFGIAQVADDFDEGRPVGSSARR
jgi:hypothetical protein